MCLNFLERYITVHKVNSTASSMFLKKTTVESVLFFTIYMFPKRKDHGFKICMIPLHYALYHYEND